jgi:hypothetical protein
VNDGELYYGVQRATTTLARGDVVDGFYRYDLAADYTDTPYSDLNFGLFIPDDTKSRNGQFTEVQFDSMQYVGNSEYKVQLSVDGLQPGDEVDFQTDLLLNVNRFGDDYTG